MSDDEFYLDDKDEIRDFTLSHQLKSIRFISYWKYSFVLKFETFDSISGQMEVGGNSDNIYRYDPTSLEWSEHRAAEIKNIYLLPSN